LTADQPSLADQLNGNGAWRNANRSRWLATSPFMRSSVSPIRGLDADEKGVGARLHRRDRRGKTGDVFAVGKVGIRAMAMVIEPAVPARFLRLPPHVDFDLRGSTTS
jgi:hypothetical protein